MKTHRSRDRQGAVGTTINERYPNAPAHQGERGFALLLVFLMAAVIGITLYAELPRVALQSQRAKEQMLVERGEQYKRAIQLFLRANKATHYPADMDDLDRGYNNLRFLRHRYKDPMTGKDEWRIIHWQGGVLTDSLLTKPKDKDGDKTDVSTLGANISAHQGLGQLADAGQAQPNATNRRRLSEGGSGGGVGPDGQPFQPADQANGTQPGVGPDGTPQQPPGIPGMPGRPGMPFGPAAGAAGIPGMPGQFPGQFPGQTPGVPGFPGNNPGAANAANTGDGAAPAAGAQMNAPGFVGGVNPANGANAANGMVPGAGLGANNAASNMLQGLLTQPRPGGFAGLQNQGTVVGGGMAGVASKMDAEGLMVYNDRTNYKEWEFVYDTTKDRPRQDPRAMLVGNQMGTPSNAPQSTTTPTGQTGAFNQPGQSGMAGQMGQGGPAGPGGPAAPGGQPGMPVGAGSSGQAAAQDIRPGRR